MANYVILGATGHVGGAVARALLEQGEAVVAVTRDAGHAEDLERAGATIAVVDVQDVDALTAALGGGTRAFLLNPPADVTTDTDAVETATAEAIATAASRVALERVVVESTYGAQPGERVGDSSVLWAFEKRLETLATPAAFIRAAYYFTNWDMSLASARDDGVIRTPYAADFEMPMVSPDDLGRSAARLLTQPIPASGVYYAEGPERYTMQQVADAFAAALGKPVRVETVPRDDWQQMFRDQGFSVPAADAYARMTREAVDHLRKPDDAVRGDIRLEDYITRLVRSDAASRVDA